MTRDLDWPLPALGTFPCAPLPSRVAQTGVWALGTRVKSSLSLSWRRARIVSKLTRRVNGVYWPNGCEARRAQHWRQPWRQAPFGSFLNGDPACQCSSTTRQITEHIYVFACPGLSGTVAERTWSLAHPWVSPQPQALSHPYTPRSCLLHFSPASLPFGALYSRADLCLTVIPPPPTQNLVRWYPSQRCTIQPRTDEHPTWHTWHIYILQCYVNHSTLPCYPIIWHAGYRPRFAWIHVYM